MKYENELHTTTQWQINQMYILFWNDIVSNKFWILEQTEDFLFSRLTTQKYLSIFSENPKWTTERVGIVCSRDSSSAYPKFANLPLYHLPKCSCLLKPPRLTLPTSTESTGESLASWSGLWAKIGIAEVVATDTNKMVITNKATFILQYVTDVLELFMLSSKLQMIILIVNDPYL